MYAFKQQMTKVALGKEIKGGRIFTPYDLCEAELEIYPTSDRAGIGEDGVRAWSDLVLLRHFTACFGRETGGFAEVESAQKKF